MTTIAIITAIAASDDLHEDDTDVAGMYGVRMGDGPGQYSAQPRDADSDGDPIEEAALDVFHDHIGIRVLDDFEIGTAILAEGEDVPDGVQWL